MVRGLISPKGELFAFLRGNVLYTLEDEPSGRLEGDLIVDLAGRPVWQVRGDGVYTLDFSETIGYFSAPTSGWED